MVHAGGQKNESLMQVYESLLKDQEWLPMDDDIFARALGLRANTA